MTPGLVLLLLRALHLQVDVAGGGGAGGGGRGAVGRRVLGRRQGRRGGGGTSLTLILGQVVGPGGDQLLEVVDPLQDAVQSREDVFSRQQATHLRKYPERDF